MQEYCSVASEYSTCAFEVGKSGLVHVITTMDPCMSPTELGVGVQIGSKSWRNFFLASNPADSRLVGEEHWPMLLHVAFNRSMSGAGYPEGVELTACLEALKSGETHCFMNNTLAHLRCASAASVAPATILTAVVSAIVFLVVMATLISSFVVWRRRREAESSNSGLGSPSGTYKRYCIFPNLPGSRPFKNGSGFGGHGTAYGGANSKYPGSSRGGVDDDHTPVAYAPLDCTTIEAGGGPMDHSLRLGEDSQILECGVETRSIQTSTTSLDEFREWGVGSGGSHSAGSSASHHSGETQRTAVVSLATASSESSV